MARFNLASTLVVCLIFTCFSVYSQTPSPGYIGYIPASGGPGPVAVPAQSANDIQVVGNYAYATTQDNKFYIIDVSTAYAPTVVSVMTHGTTPNVLLNAPAGLFVSGNYAYVAASGSNALEIIDITNPAAPVHAGVIVHGTGGAVLNSPQDVVVIGNYAYVARQDGLEIVDVTTKTAPTHKGKTASGAMLGMPAKGIAISGNYAYINNSFEFCSIDITDPTAPVIAATVSDNGNNIRINEPSPPVIKGNYLYMTTRNYSTLEVFDISTPTAPTPAGSIGFSPGGAYLINPWDVSISGNYAFVLNDNTSTLEIIDISTPTSPVHSARLDSGNGFSFLQFPLTSTVNGNYLYVGTGPAFETYYIFTPSPPTASSAAASTAGSFTAKWTALSGASSYELDVSADNFSTFLTSFNAKSLASGTTSQDVTGLDPAVTYKYRVRALNTNGTSANSNTISSTATPAAPVVSLAALAEDSFRASWPAVPNVLGYAVDVATNSDFSSIVSHAPIGTLDNFVDVPQLLPSTNYFFRARAVSATQLASAYSSTLNVTTVPHPPSLDTPSIPDITQTSFKTSWVLSPGTTSVFMDIATDAAFANKVPGFDNLTVTGNQKTISGLTANTTYYVQLRGANTGGSSANSDAVSFVTLPDAMTSLASTSSTQGTFQANWTEVPNVTRYYLDVSGVSNFDVLLTNYNNRQINPPASNISVTGLDPGTTYYYRVRCSNASGTSSNSNAIAAATLPAVPTLNDPQSVTTTGFTASWSASTGATDYFLDVATDAAFTSMVSGFDNHSTGNQTSVIVSGLTTNTSYSYRVRAANAGGSTASTAAKVVITAPVAPVATAATNPGQTTMTANWNAVANVTDYRIDVSSDATFTSNLIVNNVLVSNATTLDVTGLLSGTLYNYRIRATNATAASANSNVISQVTVPATPTTAAASPIGQTSFTANWNAVTGVTGYFVDVKDDAGVIMANYTNVSVPTGTSLVVDNGILAGTSYSYVVRAKNSAGTSPSSTAQTVLTVPPTPVPKAASKVGNVSFDANWEESKSATSYHINVYNQSGAKLPGYNNQLVGNTLTTTVTVNAPTTGGIFLYDVSASNGSGDTEFSSKITVNIPATSFPSINFPTGGTTESYMIISIPDGTHASTTLAAESFSKTWRMMQYDNSSDRNIDVPNVGGMQSGKGYWVNSNLDEAPTITITGSTNPAPKVITLAPGWNQIGDPLNYDISWADVLSKNSTVTGVGKLYTYNVPTANSGFKEYDKLKAFGGGFVNNTNSTQVTLNIPPDISASSGRLASDVITSSDIASKEWFLPLTLESGGKENTLAGIGMHEDAKVSLDKFDAIALPRFFNLADISSNHPEFFQPRFMRDVVPTASSYTWKLDITSDSRDTRLSWNNSEWTGAGLYLVDDEAGMLVDMSSVNQYNLTVKKTRSLRFVFSRDGHFNAGLAILGQPYPNPSSDRVTFPFILEDGQAVTINIVDMTGRIMGTLASDRAIAGYSELVWDAKGNGNVAPGIYMFQVRSTNGMYKTGRIVVR